MIEWVRFFKENIVVYNSFELRFISKWSSSESHFVFVLTCKVHVRNVWNDFIDCLSGCLFKSIEGLVVHTKSILSLLKSR